MGQTSHTLLVLSVQTQGAFGITASNGMHTAHTARFREYVIYDPGKMTKLTSFSFPLPIDQTASDPFIKNI